MANNNISFAMPGNQAPASNDISDNAQPDFASMSKQEQKAYDARYGSYKRLLNGKPITLFWLLNHYSEANAAAYKAQKQERKNAAKPTLSSTAPSVPLTPDPISVQPAQPSTVYDISPSAYASSPSVVVSTQEDSFGKTVRINRSKGPNQYRMPAELLCVAFNQTVQINKVPYRIGRNPNGTDLCISDNDAISGHHAEITHQDGGYYITDLCSTNHTFLDGEELIGNVPHLLSNGMKIVIADEELIFTIKE